MNSKRLMIFGTGTLAELAYYAAIKNGLEVKGFVVTADCHGDNLFLGLPVYIWGQFIEHFPPSDVSFFVAVGYRKMLMRSVIHKMINDAGYDMINIVSEHAYLGDNVIVGCNNFIFPRVVVEDNVLLGDNNVLWSNSTICHNSNIGDHNFIASGVTIGGRGQIEKSSFVGFSSTIIQDLCIGTGVIIGAQSLILSNTKDYSLYFGTPAKYIRSIDRDYEIT